MEILPLYLHSLLAYQSIVSHSPLMWAFTSLATSPLMLYDMQQMTCKGQHMAMARRLNPTMAAKGDGMRSQENGEDEVEDERMQSSAVAMAAIGDPLNVLF